MLVVSEKVKDIVSRLYALRAGVSVISIKKDEMDGLNAETKRRKLELKELSGQIQTIKRRKVEVYEKTYTSIGFSEKKKDELMERNISVEEYKFSLWSFSGMIDLFFILLICAVGWLFNKYFISNSETNEWFPALWIKYVLIGIVALVGIAAIFRYLRRFFLSIRFEIQYAQKLKRNVPEFNALKNEQEKLELHLTKKKEEYKVFCVEANERIREIVEECKILFDALKECFDDLLDVRDWKYTDLLIYYFETGRAETMKEALQQVDNERRNATLIKAVEAASDRICNTINDRAFELQQYMAQGFSIMAQGLEEMCATLINEIRAGQEAQRIQLAYIQQNLNQISDSNYMRNALIEKGNETSEKIMQDVDYMKTYGIKSL